MSFQVKNYSWQGNAALSMAAHMIDELDGMNKLKVEEWLEYDDVNWIEKSSKPYKKSLLHDYISFAINNINEYTLDKHFPMDVINLISEIMDNYEVDYTHLGNADFIGLDDDDLIDNDYDPYEVEEYGYKLYHYFMETIEPTFIDDIFTVLFANKEFLYEFNQQLRDLVVKLDVFEHPEYLKKHGVFQRCVYIPSWLKRGVFMRDKGRCQICGTDLTKILTLENQENYDHIIPLELGGTNDPVNFQLTCEHCNKSKGARSTNYNSIGARFWALEEKTELLTF